MPPDAAGKWSTERSQTFRNWIFNGFPVGPATPPDRVGPVEHTPGTRVRKDVTSTQRAEFETLRTAFTGIMERPPADPNSYFALAGIHGLPQRWCLHHEDRYNPWHRAYLKMFEDALRSVPECVDVTMPYWDLRAELPDLLQHPPFDAYVLPRDPAIGAVPPPSR